MDNVVIVNCSPRHVQFAELFCNSLLDRGYKKNNLEKIIFVLNDSHNSQDFINKSDSFNDKQISLACKSFLSKANMIGDVINNNKYRYELGSLKFALEKYTNTEQVLLIQCSYEILDLNIFNLLFCDEEKDNILGMQNGYQNYFLKIPSSYLYEIDIPIVKDKEDAVIQESQFINKLKSKYSRKMKSCFLGKPNTRYEVRFNRKNLIEETKFFRKWKGTWNHQMIKDAWK